MNADDFEHCEKYFKRFEGYVIKKFYGFDSDSNFPEVEPFPVFVLEKPDGDVVAMSVSADPEGNGGGWLFMDDPVNLVEVNNE